MWRDGYRKNSEDAMAVFAKELAPQELAAVAAYYQQVRATETVAGK
jgi:cytochrome c553